MFVRLILCVGLFLSARPVVFGAVYDCFLFFNELDILDIRLHEMAPYVDKFVLVESVETFRGNPKPLYFLKNKDRYKEFQDKIIHVILDERTSHSSAWDREYFQRNQIMLGLKDAEPNDTIFISDLDEIIRGSKIPDIVSQIHPRMVGVCHQKFHSFYLNIFSGLWTGSVVMRYSWLKKIEGPQCARNSRERGSVFFKNAGWHFSWMGAKKSVIEKIESFSHSECDTPENKTSDALRNGLNIHPWKAVKIDESFPQYVIDRLDYFVEKGFVLSDSEILELTRTGRIIPQ